MAALRDFLTSKNALNQVVVPTEVGAVIDLFEVSDLVDQPDGSTTTGTVKLTGNANESPIPGVNLGLTVPTDMAGTAPAVFKKTPAGFNLWIVLSKADKVYFAFKPIEAVPSLALVPATKAQNPDKTFKFTKAAGDGTTLVSGSGNPADQLAPSLLISGDATKPASLRFTPDTTSQPGIVPFTLRPSTVLIGDSGVALEFGGFVFDDSDTEAAALPPAGGAAQPKSDPTTAPVWRGLLCRQITLYLPNTVPIFGGRPISMWFAAGFSGGVNAISETTVEAIPAAAGQPAKPGFSARIECVDPTANGFAGLVPTLVMATVDLPIASTSLAPAGQPINFVGGRPIRARLTVSRDPVNAPGEMRLKIAFDTQGKDGLLAVRSTAMSPEHVFNVAAGMATALLASNKNNDGTLATIAGLGMAASSMFDSKVSDFVLHGVELESSGHGLPIGGELRFMLDYSVALVVKRIGFKDFGVSMDANQPFRVRVRKVGMTYAAGGVGGFKLDFEHAEMEIENPGKWDLDGLDKLFDALGSRSGRGSLWFEVDLRFKLNLGPIQVSGMTIRATIDGQGGAPKGSVTGMRAALAIPMAVHGEGDVQIDKGGFSASISATIDPINVTCDALVIYTPAMTALALGVDLPAPIPLANSGLGIYDLSGLFGWHAVPRYDPTEADPLMQRLKWEPTGLDRFDNNPSAATFGLGAVVGTVPDMGFSFSSKASLFVTVPDAAVRGALNSRVLSPRISINAKGTDKPPGYSAVGLVSVDRDAVGVAVIAQGNFEPLFRIRVPIGAYFDRRPGQASNWYLYLGADGKPGDEGRGIGPVSVEVLPGILDIGADAYFMIRGKGITDWPYGRSVPGGPWTFKDQFIVAFGFSVHSVFGPKPIAYAELNASLDLLLGTSPVTIAGFGSAGGSLHLGPFSAGVQASVAFRKQNEKEYLWAEVVARIELLFTDIEGRVTISHGSGQGPLDLPPPEATPLDRFDADKNKIGYTPALTDDTYRLLGYLSESIADAPVVWPDIIISVPFAVMPDVKNADLTQFPAAKATAAAPPQRTGSEMLSYDWALDGIALRDVTEAADKAAPGAGVPVNGKLASSWQQPRGGGAALSELILGSTGGALFARRLGDGGKSLEPDPLQSDVDFCHGIAYPQGGWAVGAKAACAPTGTRVPAEFLSGLSTQSLVQGTARHYAEGRGTVVSQRARLDMDGNAPVPSPYRLTPAIIHAWREPVTVRFDPPAELKHTFVGHYWAPNLVRGADDVRYDTQVVEVTLDAAIRAGQVLLLLPQETGVEVQGPPGVKWPLTTGLVAGIKGPTGEETRFAVAQSPVAGVPPVDTIYIRRGIFQIGQASVICGAIGIVGIRGITASAEVAAAALNQHTKDKTAAFAAQADKDKYDEQLQKWEGEFRRTILDPGRLYRLDVDLTWTGAVAERQIDGSSKSASKTDQVKTTFFFKTAPKQPPARPNEAMIPSWANKPISRLADGPKVNASLALIKQTRTDTFDASLIERYFGGYTPAQSELFRFCNDPLAAHFTQDHVKKLAEKYGYDLKLAWRRVDKAPEDPTKDLNSMLLGWQPLWATQYLSQAQTIVDQAIAASTCAQPRPGTTGKVKNPPLAPRAWYELYVQATETGKQDELGRLRGVTFRTSRWGSAQDMLADVLTGAGPASAPYLRGDILVDIDKMNALRAAVKKQDDLAFEAAAVAIGTDGWPEAVDPRISWLWVLTNADTEEYRLVGLMIESPEPINRPGRVQLAETADLAMGTTGSKEAAFQLVRSDSASCRFIYLSSEAIAVRTWELQKLLIAMPPRKVKIDPAIVLKATVAMEGEAEKPVTQSVRILAAPSFAEVV